MTSNQYKLRKRALKFIALHGMGMDKDKQVTFNTKVLVKALLALQNGAPEYDEPISGWE